MARVLVTKETADGESRVAATPETVGQMKKLGLEVSVEAGAGEPSFFADADYEAAGATVVGPEAYAEADVILCVRTPTEHAEKLQSGALVIGFLAPYRDDETIRTFVERGVTTLPMELVPRITRAQKMDALSSQASIAGYKAVLIAASQLPKYFPLLMTAAGTVKPARVVIMGAGVAGLQAIATAKRLGAVVEASDIRPAVQEQVESLGAKFIELPKLEGGEDQGGYAREVTAEFLAKQREIVAKHVAAADVVVTTALVPGRPAPKLVTAEMVRSMKSGAIIVDMAVEQGGNCELSERGTDVRKHGVLIVGHPNLPATMPADASMLYARNVLALLENTIGADGAIEIDPEDDVTGGTLLTHEGRVFHVPTAERLGVEPVDRESGTTPVEEKKSA